MLTFSSRSPQASGSGHGSDPGSCTSLDEEHAPGSQGAFGAWLLKNLLFWGSCGLVIAALVWVCSLVL